MNRYAIPDAEWIETGTYRGTTTNYLSRHFPHVHTIEPQLDFYESVKLKFKEKNITVYHGTSEDILPGLLPKVNRVLNFWLDGHYSGGETFQGKNECPIEIELREIERNKYDPQNLTVFIDDVRCFASRTEYLSYPDLDFLTGWAARNGLNWIVEHDILVLKKF